MAFSWGWLGVGDRAWSRVLITVHRDHLVGEIGALTYLLADHLEVGPMWSELSFVIGNTVDWRGMLHKVTLQTFIGNLFSPVCDYSVKNGLILMCQSDDGGCNIELSDPESVEKFRQAVGGAVDMVLGKARSDGWIGRRR